MPAVLGVADVTFSEKIKELSKVAGLSERKLAEKAGIPFGTVHNYFISKAVPSWINMIKIAEALGVECSVFRDCDEDLQSTLKVKGRGSKRK
jgi:transcriptional regulator with XRE-family HTH domain